MGIQKKISFDDIKVGDKIRVVDVINVEVKEVSSSHVGAHAENGRTYSFSETNVNWAAGKRTFQLLERVIAPLPTTIGSAVKLQGDVWFLTAERLTFGAMWHNTYTGEILGKMSMAGRVHDAGGFKVIV